MIPRAAPLSLIAFLAACAAPEPALPEGAELEFIHARITSFDAIDDGVVVVGFGPMARLFAIHPELSPDAAELQEFARAAHEARREIHATAWIRERVSKGAPGAGKTDWPFVVVRLADSEDPRGG